MAQEMEAKFSVADFRAVRRALRAAGGVYLGTAEHVDEFFDTPERKLYRGDRGLRLRNVRVLRGAAGGVKSGWLLTYKGPRQANRSAKVREEIQTHVTDGVALAEILRQAGLKTHLEIKKRRSSYRLGRCLVELDELPGLGGFVEIEAPSERALQQTRRKLALTGEPITESYAHLVARKT